MSIECPHCGLEQQPRIVTRPQGISYDTDELGIKDDPHGSHEIFVAFEDRPESYWAIGKCLKTECKKNILAYKTSYG